jgi:glycine cleavage system aminomethyltransferase T
LGDDVVGTLFETVYSPRMKRNIAIALINSDVDEDENRLLVDTGSEVRDAAISGLPFC